MVVVQNTAFGSDYHFDHPNVIKYDKRPFKDVHHMNESIIANHNALVKDSDNFYYLGDFAFSRKTERVEEHLKRLNGNKFFIDGNHDRKIIKLYEKYGTYLGSLAEINVGDRHIVLCHYPLLVWNRSHHGSWHLFGHCHQSLPDNPHSLSFDAGCNGWGYGPVIMPQVEKKMATKIYKPIDHHGTREGEQYAASAQRGV